MGEQLKVALVYFSTLSWAVFVMIVIEQQTLKNVTNCFNTNIYSYSETSGGQSLNKYLNVIYFFNASANYTSVEA